MSRLVETANSAFAFVQFIGYCGANATFHPQHQKTVYVLYANSNGRDHDLRIVWIHSTESNFFKQAIMTLTHSSLETLKE